MRRIFIILLLIFSMVLIGCSPQVLADSTITPETVTVTSIVEIENTGKIERLEADNFKLKAELEKYKELISGLNELLGNVYYGYASNSNWVMDGFTAFNLKYNDKYYLITAGHCIENEYGKFGNFKFKANFSDNWIYPKLLAYNVDEYAEFDYGIFYSDKINSGFIAGKPEGANIILGNTDGNLNITRTITSAHKNGESGSPIININGEVIGILTGGITKIDKVTEAIDNLK
jgi:hypothetical protein